MRHIVLSEKRVCLLGLSFSLWMKGEASLFRKSWSKQPPPHGVCDISVQCALPNIFFCFIAKLLLRPFHWMWFPPPQKKEKKLPKPNLEIEQKIKICSKKSQKVFYWGEDERICIGFIYYNNLQMYLISDCWNGSRFFDPSHLNKLPEFTSIWLKCQALFFFFSFEFWFWAKLSTNMKIRQI